MSATKKRILVIDDEPAITELISMFLCDEGYEINTCSDACDIFEQMSLHQPDLLILDVMMPTLSGVDVSQMLDSDIRFRRIPILFLTAVTNL